MKNYYEILEVDKKASPEVIEKAYKTLVKKYHPDLQEAENNGQYEEKMKEINEAYSVLSDDFKKSNYVEQVKESTISIEEYNRLVQENQNLRAQIENINAQFNRSNVTNKTVNNNQNNTRNDDTISRMSRVMYENIKQARAQAYNDAYEQDLRNRGYTIKYKHDFKYYLKFAGCICIMILILFIIYQIPIVKKFVNQLYEENLVIHAIVNIFKKTFSTPI